MHFGPDVQQLTCEFCDNTFDIDTVRAFNDSQCKEPEATISWDSVSDGQWTGSETEAAHAYQCPSCGGKLLTDDTTAASFCPYCDNPTIMPSQLSGGLKPDGVIPFKTSKEDAQAAFQRLCKGKPLLPKDFTAQHRLEKITGMYVPFWLFDCDAQFDGSYKATRVKMWSDSHYNYKKTEHFLLERSANASFCKIPMDGSEKMDDAFMESIEPYDYRDIVDFDMAYLSGYLADKYDVSAESSEERVRQRVEQSMQDQIQNSLMGYHTVLPTNRQLKVQHGTASYVLLPVWILNTKFNGKIYTFAMNGQTGKMTGSFPVCPKRSAAWFAGICAGVTVLTHLIQMML